MRVIKKVYHKIFDFKLDFAHMFRLKLALNENKEKHKSYTGNIK